MSLSSDEEEDNVGVTECSPLTDRSDGDKEDEADSTEELIAKVGTECKTLIHDNIPTQDVAGPQLSKETMKGAKRVDEISPNMILNKTILDHYHNVKIDDLNRGLYCYFFIRSYSEAELGRPRPRRR